MRIIFMGTPRAAVTALEAVMQGGQEVAAVVAQPDKPAGRGRRTHAPPVKELAAARGIPVLQPSTLRKPEAAEEIAGFEPEALVVVSYGKILPPELLGLAPLGAVNLHFSLLPRWRGAAPVQRCLAAGEEKTGVTTMQMDEGLDTGPILLQEECAVLEEETAPDLERRLAGMGGTLLNDTLRGLAAGTLAARPQDEARATWAPMVKKEEGRVDWSLSAPEIFNRWRAFQPWPGLFTYGGDRRFVLEAVRPHGEEVPEEGGTVLGCDGESLLVACGTGTLRVERLRPEGRKGMTGRAALNGRHVAEGDRWGGPPDERQGV